ncbi:hypothetical protein VC83_05257 [Pseudogymnoascus destructans]|uniref:Uncharacterized protein n=1 Tax=Pseudogymnoascus destructans TaxID=655981 RepID=A0A177A7J1_9PEZI|nr:uncharacterized protein VC83_05257 [Pseudogymnoascus destructans]OAF58099.1 hypothetical protein VC83_05257 [Pseudogymnoascus destructans]
MWKLDILYLTQAPRLTSLSSFHKMAGREYWRSIGIHNNSVPPRRPDEILLSPAHSSAAAPSIQQTFAAAPSSQQTFAAAPSIQHTFAAAPSIQHAVAGEGCIRHY